MTNWYGVLAPAALPKPLVERLNRGIGDALRGSELQERFRRDAVEVIASSPIEFQRHIADEVGKSERVVTASGIRID